MDDTNPKSVSMRQDPPAADTLRVVPLGGVGEFGKNAIALEWGQDLIVLDCGQKFPEAEMLGVDSVIPDFSYILDNRDRLRGVFLTHGHEDHIGALPHFLRQLPGDGLPIYGSPLTLALARHKLVETELEDRCCLIELEHGRPVEVGSFTVEPIAVSHSFPMAMSLAIHLPVGTVIHTGDYKFDADDPATDQALEAFARIGRGGVELLMSDSTNVERSGTSPTESMVCAGLREVLAAAPRTLILACFSSSLSRVQTVLDLADELGRKVAVCGFSLERNFEIASEMGLLRYPSDLVWPLNDLTRLPAERRLILTTGTQGETMSALSRLSLNTMKGYRIAPDDLVVLSSRIIPGNERAIYRMINHFYRHGARVVTERDAMVHASGHAYRGEMRRLIELTRPRWLMPVHGEMRQMVCHRDLAVASGLPEEAVVVVENGAQVELGPLGAAVAPTAWAGQVLVDGRMLDEVEEVVLRDRQHLAEDGMMTVILVIDQHSHRIIAGPDIVSRGFVLVDENEELMQACKDLVVRTFEECDPESQEEWDVVKQSVRKALRRYLRETVDRYPMILPVVLEI